MPYGGYRVHWCYYCGYILPARCTKHVVKINCPRCHRKYKIIYLLKWNKTRKKKPEDKNYWKKYYKEHPDKYVSLKTKPPEKIMTFDEFVERMRYAKT